MLVLFDIDLTLVTTHGAGRLAMIEAGKLLHGSAFHADGVSFAGRLDPLIIHDLLSVNSVEPTPALLEAFRATYREQLPKQLSRSGAIALPGVIELTSRLASLPSVTLGLLTGNFPETGRAKLKAAGIDPEWFPIQIWGDDSPHVPPARDHLPRIGMDRYVRHTGRSIDPASVIVIGDTPHDIACARAHRCRSIGVATGRSSVEELEAARADVVFQNLAQAERVLQWIMSTP